MSYKYQDYLHDVEQLHTDIINACRKYKLGTLVCETHTIDGHYKIEVILADFRQEDFEE